MAIRVSAAGQICDVAHTDIATIIAVRYIVQL